MTQTRPQFFEAYQALSGDYAQKKKEVNGLKLSLNTLRPKVVSYRKEVAQLRRETEALTAEITELDLKRSRLSRNLDIFKSTFDKFAKLLEDARVAKSSRPSDLKIVARAMDAALVPADAPRQVVMLAAAVGLVLSVFLAFFLEYMEKAKARLAEEREGVN